MKTQRSQSGFTLIETIIYIGLFVLVMTAVLLSTYNMIESTDKGQYRSLIHNEAQFVVRKFNTLLNGATGVTVNGASLTIHYPSPAVDKVLDFSNGKIRVDNTPLNGDIAPVTSFTITPSSGVLNRPALVEIAFRMQNAYYDETFTAKKLIR